MSARVFISCGQATPAERSVASELAAWLTSQGYVPYIAVNVQTILELNLGIITALKDSDYYLQVNFKREELVETNPAAAKRFRGSLYTHQELAVAYALGFQNMILIQ